MEFLVALRNSFYLTTADINIKFFFHQSGLFSLKVIFGLWPLSLKQPLVCRTLFFNLAHIFHHTVSCKPVSTGEVNQRCSRCA